MADAAFDGVWANACLLHVPRTALPGILAKVQRALRPGGVFYASYKAGEAEGRDRFGRFFNYPDAAWLKAAAMTRSRHAGCMRQRSSCLETDAMALTLRGPRTT